MPSYLFYILIAGFLLLPITVGAQTQPGEARPTTTPEHEARVEKTEPAKQVEPETILEFGSSYEFVDSDNPDWQTYYFSFTHKFSSGKTLYGTASAVSRFNTTDPNFMIGFFTPLNKSKSWMTTFEVSASPTHEILPTVSLFGKLERNFGKGWLGSAGMRHTRYSTDVVNMGVFGVERYFKAYRGAYTLYVANLKGKGTAVSHVFNGNYYYGERNSVGLGFAFGQEIESIPTGVLRTDVLDVSLVGRHWVTPKWGFTYVAVWHRQGTLYTRGGPQLGLLYRF